MEVEGDRATCRLASDEPSSLLGARSGDRGPSETVLLSTPFSTFEVVYQGFSKEAQTAFQRAVDLVARNVVTLVPVKIEAHWENIGGEFSLGRAGPTAVYLSQTSGPFDPVWIPVGLENQLVEEDVNGDSPEIVARFNSNTTRWYFGLDGKPPAGKFDFVSIVLHELCHGLGMITSVTFNNGAGTAEWGIEASSGSTQGIFPLAYDLFLSDSSNQSLIDPVEYANPSQELGRVVTGDALFFMGPSARENHNHNPVSLYAPSEWSEGASVAHLDEFVFMNASGESLMTPTIVTGESTHQLGAIVTGILRDMGWTIMEQSQLAQFAAGSGIQSDVVVSNPSLESVVSGRVDFFDPDGAPINPSGVLVGGGLPTFNIPPLGSVTFSTISTGSLFQGSAVVSSSAPVSTIIRFDLPGTGVAGVGVSPPAEAVILPARRQGGLSTGAAIRNPGLQPLRALVYLQNEQGQDVDSTTVMVPPGGRVARFIHEFFSVPVNFKGTLIILAESGRISVVGLELEAARRFTTLPVRVLR